MEMFWRTKGKRIAAWLMIALIMATTIPFGSISASADDTTTDESDAVTITGQVMVPGNDDENTDTNNGTPYAGAKVTVTYPQSGSTPVTNEATTTDDGKFNISIGNWTLNTDNKYTVKVEPADVDKGTYDSYSSEEKTVREDQVKNLGPYVENADEFPERMNLQICRQVDKGNLEIEIWERGSGYTKASGTGSCAAAAAAYKLGLVESRINVNQPGGMIQIDMEEDGTIYMTGTVGYIADISVAESFFS